MADSQALDMVSGTSGNDPTATTTTAPVPLSAPAMQTVEQLMEAAASAAASRTRGKQSAERRRTRQHGCGKLARSRSGRSWSPRDSKDL